MKFSIELSPEQLNIVDKALQTLPLGQTLDTYLSIKSQIESQTTQSKSEQKELISTESAG